MTSSDRNELADLHDQWLAVIVTLRMAVGAGDKEAIDWCMTREHQNWLAIRAWIRGRVDIEPTLQVVRVSASRSMLEFRDFANQAARLLDREQVDWMKLPNVRTGTKAYLFMELAG
jgi:hypothetical protein